MRKFYRSRRDKKLTGLCGGLSEYMNVDATLLRVLLIVITIFSSGFVIVVYVLAALVVPKEPPLHGGYGPHGYGPGGQGPHGYGGGFPPPGGGYNGGFGGQGGSYNPPPQQSWGAQNPQPGPQAGAEFDSMMDDLEKKALRREIEELKSKLAKHEKGE